MGKRKYRWFRFRETTYVRDEKVDETGDYKEYEVTTFRTPKDRNSTNEDDQSYIFTSATDSMVFCNEKMKIQMPKKVL